MYKSTFPNALCAKRRSMIEGSNPVCYSLYRFLIPHGRVYPWILSLDYQSLFMEIWTIVDRFSKQAHFILVKKTIKAHHMATLFISQVFKYHGLPTSIVSDRDPRMTSNFWKGLFENLGTKLNFSLAYHPQTDGQSEIAN